jgi:hypothetical protein
LLMLCISYIASSTLSAGSIFKSLILSTSSLFPCQ